MIFNNIVLTLRIVGATLVVALFGSRRLNALYRLGAHKGRPYTDGFDVKRMLLTLRVSSWKF